MSLRVFLYISIGDTAQSTEPKEILKEPLTRVPAEPPVPILDKDVYPIVICGANKLQYQALRRIYVDPISRDEYFAVRPAAKPQPQLDTTITSASIHSPPSGATGDNDQVIISQADVIIPNTNKVSVYYIMNEKQNTKKRYAYWDSTLNVYYYPEWVKNVENYSEWPVVSGVPKFEYHARENVYIHPNTQDRYQLIPSLPKAGAHRSSRLNKGDSIVIDVGHSDDEDSFYDEESTIAALSYRDDLSTIGSLYSARNPVQIIPNINYTIYRAKHEQKVKRIPEIHAGVSFETKRMLSKKQREEMFKEQNRIGLIEKLKADLAVEEHKEIVRNWGLDLEDWPSEESKETRVTHQAFYKVKTVQERHMDHIVRHVGLYTRHENMLSDIMAPYGMMVASGMSYSLFDKAKKKFLDVESKEDEK